MDRRDGVCFICLRADVSMMVICSASYIMGYDIRRSEMSKAPLHMKQDITSRAIDP